MPLVKLFARPNLTKAVPLARLQDKMCRIWGTQPATTKLILLQSQDWTTTYSRGGVQQEQQQQEQQQQEEDVYVDIRAYGKAERTREFVLAGMQDIQKAFADEDLVANVRLEVYEGERYFHLPPPATSTNK